MSNIGQLYSMMTTNGQSITLNEGLIISINETVNKGEKEIKVISLFPDGAKPYEIFPFLYILNVWVREGKEPEVLKKDISAIFGANTRKKTFFSCEKSLVFTKGILHVSEILSDRESEDLMLAYEALYSASVESFGVERVYREMESSHVSRDFVHPTALYPYAMKGCSDEVSIADRRIVINAERELYSKIAVIVVKDNTDALLRLGELLGLDTSMVKDHRARFYTKYFCDKVRRQILPVNKSIIWDKEYSADALERIVRRVKVG